MDNKSEKRSKPPKKNYGHKSMPAAPEVEQAILGSILIDTSAIARVLQLITPAAFFEERHQLIFESIVKLFNKNEALDLMTVYDELQRNGTADAAGGLSYLAELSGSAISSANVENHCKIILERSMLRELINTAGEISEKAFDETEDSFKILDYAERKIFEITEGHLKRSYLDMNAAVHKAMEYIETVHRKDYTHFAVPTGFYDLDELLGGFQKTDLVIIAARPSMGKTALALNFVRNAALEHKIPVALFSLEMSTLQLLLRFICSEGRLDAYKIRTGKASSADSARLPKIAANLRTAPIYIDDAPAQTILEIRAKARRLKTEKQIGMIVIDYLQLIRSPDIKESREREISHISRSLKGLAKELDIPVLALAQLNRSPEARTDKRPQLSDLRESGSIEQDADVVMFINRPDYYKKGLTDEQGNDMEGIAEIIVAKHRNGPTDDVKLKFQKEYARFDNVEQQRFLSETTYTRPDDEPIM